MARLPFYAGQHETPGFRPRGRIHGRYCGWGHTAGHPDVPPVDELDAICRRHDLGYDEDGFLDCAVDLRFVNEMTAWIDEAKRRGLPADVIANAEMMRGAISAAQLASPNKWDWIAKCEKQPTPIKRARGWSAVRGPLGFDVDVEIEDPLADAEEIADSELRAWRQDQCW